MRGRARQDNRELRDDEPARRRRRRGADVGGEIAQRRVLLVADRGHDRHAARCHRADDAFVAERQEVLEAAAAAGEHDHLDVVVVTQRLQRVDDLNRRGRGP